MNDCLIVGLDTVGNHAYSTALYSLQNFTAQVLNFVNERKS